MTDLDRYVTAGAVRAIRLAEAVLLESGVSVGNGISDDDMDRTLLRAVLPGILAQHRADVLREAARRAETWAITTLQPERIPYLLRLMADEAAPE